jgi:hypothetical protein
MAIIITIGLLLASFDRASCYDKCDLNDPLLTNQLNRPDPGSDTTVTIRFGGTTIRISDLTDNLKLWKSCSQIPFTLLQFASS